MLRDLQTQVQSEGKAEATTYDKFACFCKSKTDQKSTSITEGETAVEGLTADLNELTATRNTLNEDIQGLNEDLATFEKELQERKDLRAEEKATFDANFLDMSKAVTQLENAIKDMKASMSFASVSSSVRRTLALADAMGVAPKTKVVTALLAGDVPTADYDFHSGDIITTLEELHSTFKEQKIALESAEADNKSNFDIEVQGKTDQIKTTQNTLSQKQKELATTTSNIASTQEELTEKNAVLNDDRNYLRDLTAKCETKAKEWDQRSSMRADELAAITQALSVIEGSVAQKASTTGEGGRSALVSTAVDADEDEEDDDDSVAFVQVRKSTDPRQMKIVSLLRTEAKKLNSPSLSILATKITADPFAKIKTLIQELIERLLQEAAEEANHKGWCDNEISKAEQDRDYRVRDIDNLHSSLEELNSRKAKLTEEEAKLTADIANLEESLANTTKIRQEESHENSETVSESKDGVDAVSQAIDILAHFYGKAKKATVEFVEGPVDDEAPDAGFGGAYTGSQSASTGILGMLDVIKSDFDRTISETEAAEDQAKRDYVEFERETKMSIATKQNALDATTTELTETNDDISTDTDDLRNNQDLLDAAVDSLIKLHPACTGQGASDPKARKEAREAEIEALKQAICILDEDECSLSFLQIRRA